MFRDNVAFNSKLKSWGNGGVVIASNCPDNGVTLTNADMVRNKARNAGGAVQLNYCNATMIGCEFVENTLDATDWVRAVQRPSRIYAAY